MKIKKKLKKVWGKIKLLETSAVGIPVYPAAHKSYSLVKALRETEEPFVGDELNLEKDNMGEDSEQEETPESTSEEAPVTEETTEENPETPAEPAEESEEEPEVEKSIKPGVIANEIAKGIRIAMENIQTERGLVEGQKSIKKMVEEKVKSMTTGELAIQCGLFKKPAVMGVEEW